MASPSPPPLSPPSPSLLRRLIQIDTTLSLHLYTLTHPHLPYLLLKTLELSGDGRFFFPLIISLLLSPLSTSPHSPFLLNLLIGLLLDLLVIGLLKHLVRRPRPIYNKSMFLTFSVDHWSFPSGHASRVFFVSTFIFLSYQFGDKGIFENYVDGEGILGNCVLGSVGVWAVVTAVSRVLLGRHFVMDVVAGAGLGVVEAVLVVRVFNYENLISFFGAPINLGGPV